MTCSFAYRDHAGAANRARIGRECCGSGTVESLGEVLKLVGPEVAVAIQRHHRRLVAEGTLHRLDAGALADQQACCRVPKVVGAMLRGQARPLGGRL